MWLVKKCSLPVIPASGSGYGIPGASWLGGTSVLVSSDLNLENMPQLIRYCLIKDGYKHQP